MAIAARESDTAYVLRGLGSRRKAFIDRLAVVAGSLAEYDLRNRRLKQMAPQCKFVNTAPRKR